VSMSRKIPPPMTNGNQPPSNNYIKLEAQNAKSTMKKNPVAPMHK
jgi:hypothetical protein